MMQAQIEAAVLQSVAVAEQQVSARKPVLSPCEIVSDSLTTTNCTIKRTAELFGPTEFVTWPEPPTYSLLSAHSFTT